MTQYTTKLEDASTRLMDFGNVAVHGGPGAGKSFFLASLRSAVEAHESVVELNLSRFPDGQSLSEQLCRTLTTPDCSQSASMFEHFSHVRRTLTESNRTCLFLDEFDAVLHYDDAAAFIRLLREGAEDPRSSGLALSIGSRRSLNIIEEAVTGISTLDGIMYPYFLSSLSKTDVETGWPAEAERDWVEIGRATGMIPGLLQHYFPGCHSDATFTTVREQWCEKQMQWLEKIGLLAPLAQLLLGPITDVSAISKARLYSQNLIHDETKGRDHQSLAEFALFVDRLTRRARGDLKLWGIWGDAESSARCLSTSVAVLCHGTDSAIEPEVGSLGGHWAFLHSKWSVVGPHVSPSNPTFWKNRLQHLGGLGFSPNVDLSEFAGLSVQWQQDIDAATARLTQRSRDVADWPRAETAASSVVNV